MEKVLIFGAGNIGRGFIGQLFSQSGYEVVFVDINEEIINVINREGSYPISIVSDESTEEIIIGPVRGVDARNVDVVAGEFLEVDLIATAVGMNALGKVSSTIAYGLENRWSHGNFNPINILICENMLNADEFMREEIISGLKSKEQSFFNDTVGLVETSIGRMVPVAVQNKDHNPLRVFVEEYDQLPVDREGFKGDIPNIKNMIPYSPFIYYIHRKLFMHNMGHAIAAYLGFLEGYKYIWESMADPDIKKIVIGAFRESAFAVSKEHKMPLQELLEHGEDLMRRFGNKALGDTMERVAKDLIRKLAIKDRLSGTALLCTQHDIVPTHICLGIAAGFLYTPPRDEEAFSVQEYIEERGIGEAITYFCSFEGQDIKHQLILKFYNQLKNGERLESIASSI